MPSAARGRICGVDVGLGADVDAGGRLVEQQHPAGAAQRPGEQHLLLIAAGERVDRRLGAVGADGEARRSIPPSRGVPPSGGRRQVGAGRKTFSRTPNVGTSPVRARSSPSSTGGAAHSIVPAAAAQAGDALQHGAAAGADESGEADDLAGADVQG